MGIVCEYDLARVTLIIILGLDAAISSKIMKKFAFYLDINKYLLQLSKQDYMSYFTAL